MSPDLLPRVAQAKTGLGRGAPKLDGHQQERRPAGSVGLFGIDPFQEAQGEVERVHALLLEEGPRVTVDLEQHGLELLLAQTGLEPAVGVARRGRTAFAVLLGLAEELGKIGVLLGESGHEVVPLGRSVGRGLVAGQEGQGALLPRE